MNIPKKPRSGIWGDDDVYKAYSELVNELIELIPEHQVGLHISGVASMCRAKTASIKSKAAILDKMVKACCVGRK
jgi:hypothetical protein